MGKDAVAVVVAVAYVVVVAVVVAVTAVVSAAQTAWKMENGNVSPVVAVIVTAASQLLLMRPLLSFN